MKKVGFILTIATVIAAFSGVCCSSSARVTEHSLSVIAVPVAPPSKKTDTVVFKTRLHCENCVKKVTENISFLKGVKDLEVSLEKQQIRVVYDTRKTSVDILAAELRKLGYPAVAKQEKD